MKKNLIITFAFVLIFLHIIPPNSISYAVEELENCESIGFNIQTIIIDTDKITGTSDPSQPLKIEFKRQNKTENINVDLNGNYEVEIEEDFLEINDEITFKNEYHKIETKVVSNDVETTIIESVQYAECIEDNEVEKEKVAEELENSQDDVEQASNEAEEIIKKEEVDDTQAIINEKKYIKEETENITNEKVVKNEDKTSEELMEQEGNTHNKDSIKNVDDEQAKYESMNGTENSIKERSKVNLASKCNYGTSSENLNFNLTLVINDFNIKDRKITGKVSGYPGNNPGRIEVFYWNEERTIDECVIIDNDGKFEMELKGSEGETLYFQAVQGNQGSARRSAIVRKTFQRPTLKLDVPSSIQFEDTMISNKEVTINRKEDLVVSVTDTRLNDKWKLSVKASPLSNGDYTIDNAIYFVNEEEKLLSEDEGVLVATGNSGKNIQELRWANNQGILLKLNPLQAQANTPYQSTITWTLADGP